MSRYPWGLSSHEGDSLRYYNGIVASVTATPILDGFSVVTFIPVNLSGDWVQVQVNLVATDATIY